LKDQFGLTVGREDFEAIDKAQALVIAAAIWNASSDIALGYELWGKDERILPPQESTAPGASEVLSDYERQTVIGTMVALRDSNWLITASEKLVREIERLRASSTSGASQADGCQTGPIASPFERFIASIESPALRTIAKHWSDVRCDKSMPSWDDLCSSALAPHFKLLWGYQFDRRNSEFTGRLAGTHIRQWLGPNFCSAKLEDILPRHILREGRAFLAKVVTTPGLGLCSGRLFTIGGHTVRGERLALPLATDGISADGILGVSDYAYPSVSGPVALIHENIEWWPLPGSGGSPRS
jgi:hypothetical protein